MRGKIVRLPSLQPISMTLSLYCTVLSIVMSSICNGSLSVMSPQSAQLEGGGGGGYDGFSNKTLHLSVMSDPA